MAETTPPNDATYDLLLALEGLESLREQMAELGVERTDDLAGLADAEAADLLRELRALGLDSLAAVQARIDELHRRLDAHDAPPA